MDVCDKPELKGKRLETIIAAILFLACQRNKVNISREAFESVCDVDLKKLQKAETHIRKYIPSFHLHARDY